MAEMGKKSEGSFLRSVVIISVIMMLVIITAAAIFLAFQDEDKTDFVVLKADTSPVRVEPDIAGGKDIDHQDSAVLQMLDEIKAPEGEVERLVLPDANPELPPVTLPSDETELAQQTAPILQIGDVDKQSADAEVSSSNISSSDNNIEIQDLDAQAGAKNAQSDAKASQEDQASQPVQEAQPDQDDQSEQSLADIMDRVAGENTPSAEAIPAARPDVAEAQSKPATQQPAEPKIIETPASFDTDNPPLMVQVAAFREQTKAVEAAALLTEKHRARLLSLQLGIMAIDTGSSGVFWRVITEPLPSVDARNICDMLKAAGQDCILRPILLGGL